MNGFVDDLEKVVTDLYDVQSKVGTSRSGGGGGGEDV